MIYVAEVIVVIITAAGMVNNNSIKTITIATHA